MLPQLPHLSQYMVSLSQQLNEGGILRDIFHVQVVAWLRAITDHPVHRLKCGCGRLQRLVPRSAHILPSTLCLVRLQSGRSHAKSLDSDVGTRHSALAGCGYANGKVSSAFIDTFI